MKLILRLSKNRRVLVLFVLLVIAVAWYLRGNLLNNETDGDIGGGLPDGWLGGRPDAVGMFVPSPLASEVSGSITLHRTNSGTRVTVQVSGLPAYEPGEPPIGPHGFHIHEVGECEVGDPEDPFLSAGLHWNPDDQPHGNHAGDFPVIFSDQGSAVVSFITHRFTPRDVIGLSVIIHENPDDYRSQPTGASGRRIACAAIGEVDGSM